MDIPAGDNGGATQSQRIVHQRVYREFESICSRECAGGAVLEVGASPGHRCLLDMKCLGTASSRVGLNIDGPFSLDRYEIVKGNDMSMFAGDAFDTVLCNAVLEHDPYFWKTLSELKRVAKPGGLIVIGAPGYGEWRSATVVRKVLKRLPLVSTVAHSLVSSTPTLNIHAAPGDYYRFSEQAFREVFLEGLDDVVTTTVMMAPRIIGWGRKPKTKR